MHDQGMSSGSSSSGGDRPRGPGELEGSKRRCYAGSYAGDDNHLLKLDEGALKVLNDHLGNEARWHLAMAVGIARQVRNRSKFWEPVDW